MRSADDIFKSILKKKKEHRIKYGRWPTWIDLTIEEYKILSAAGYIECWSKGDVKPGPYIYYSITVCGISVVIGDERYEG